MCGFDAAPLPSSLTSSSFATSISLRRLLGMRSLRFFVTRFFTSGGSLSSPSSSSLGKFRCFRWGFGADREWLSCLSTSTLECARFVAGCISGFGRLTGKKENIFNQLSSKTLRLSTSCWFNDTNKQGCSYNFFPARPPGSDTGRVLCPANTCCV